MSGGGNRELSVLVNSGLDFVRPLSPLSEAVSTVLSTSSAAQALSGALSSTGISSWVSSATSAIGNITPTWVSTGFSKVSQALNIFPVVGGTEVTADTVMPDLTEMGVGSEGGPRELTEVTGSDLPVPVSGTTKTLTLADFNHVAGAQSPDIQVTNVLLDGNPLPEGITWKANTLDNHQK